MRISGTYKPLILVAVWLLLVATGASCSQKPSTEGFSIDLRKQLAERQPVEPAKPLAERVGQIPDSILDPWKAMDRQLNPQANRYRPYTLSDDQQKKFAAAILTLPESWQMILQRKLARFYFVENLLGGGISDWLIDGDGQLIYTMILNPALFSYSAGEWLEMRENSSFTKGEYRLALKGAGTISALQMVLWHESAHLIDYESGKTLAVDPLLHSYRHSQSRPTPITRNIWNEDVPPEPLFHLPYRKALNAYGLDRRKQRLANALLPEIFRQWQKSPFVTLYASSSPMEDFADFAAFSLAADRSGVSPYWQLERNGEPIAAYQPLDHPLNDMRRAYLNLGVGPLPDLSITAAQAGRIGERIFFNECGGKDKNLTSWNSGEAFASLGIGHFIWYPAGTTGPFRESFPELMKFMKRQGVPLPSWLEQALKSGAPWPSQAEFLQATDSPRMIELRHFLQRTTGLQVRFMIRRLHLALVQMLDSLSDEQRKWVRERIQQIFAQPMGYYALVDYVNFKGDGTKSSERYRGEGWGLLQVLQSMQDSSDALTAFADAAAAVLKRRVANSPPERQEQRWLAGWLKRIDSYRP